MGKLPGRVALLRAAWFAFSLMGLFSCGASTRDDRPNIVLVLVVSFMCQLWWALPQSGSCCDGCPHPRPPRPCTFPGATQLYGTGITPPALTYAYIAISHEKASIGVVFGGDAW